MNQVPCLPVCAPQQVNPYYNMPVQQPMQQPNYNAVKIDIINPSVGVPNGYQPQYQQPTAPIYNYPNAPIYNYPTATAPQQYPPVCIPQYPQAEIPQIPAQQPPVDAQIPQAQPQVITEPVPAAAVQQAPTVIQQQNQNAPTVTVAPTEEAPKAEVPEPQVSKPEIVPPVTVEPKLDINEFVARLANPDFEAQAAAMEDIATIIKDRKNPEKPDGLQAARTLVDAKIYDELNNIINFDSSKLDGPTQEQIDARQKILSGKQVTPEEEKLANTMTAKEQAERNKSYALFTLAIMDELYADEVSHLPDSTMPPLTDLPKANVLVEQLKDNPNPMVRSSAVTLFPTVSRIRLSNKRKRP